MQHYFSREVKLLLINQSAEKDIVLYNDNAHSWTMPKIGKRPPFFTNPRYEQYYPVI
ncbi:hypothetical protein SAMN05443252_103515 [Bacillus sp. OV322]|nr:hypothetical protein SAMN05443252_103515 [Bacillus sp. OV322]